MEFVAEVYTGKIYGKSHSDRVDSMYDRMGGQPVTPNVPASKS